MPSFTSRLRLTKPAGTERVKVTDITTAFDKIDAAVGMVICTSSTRPIGPDRWDGLIIKETDTGAWGFWDSTANAWIMYDTKWQTWNGQAAQPGKHFLGTNQTPTAGATGKDVGYYMRNGYEITYQALISFAGAGRVAGVGGIVVPIPFQMVHESVGVPVGQFFINDAGSALWLGSVMNSGASPSSSLFLYTSNSSTGAVYAGGPWATQIGATDGDQISVRCVYMSNLTPVT